MTKVKSFIKQKYVYFIIAGLFVLFSVVADAIMGIFPFGPNTVATYDAWHQVCPLYNLIFDFFEGKSTLFYSTNVGGGINTFGVLTYYIVSPFSVFFLMFGRGGLYFAYGFVLLLKTITTAIVACFFIRKVFKNVNKVYQIVLSVLYATGGYFVFLHTWITWIDFMIYMPLLFLAYKNLIENEKILPFAIVMALLIFTCFGIGSFSFIILFVLFVAYSLICLDKEKQKRVLTNTVLGLIVAIGIALFLLVPSFLQYLGSSRTGGFFETLFTKPVFNEHTSDKLATVVGDGLMLLFAIIYVVKCDKKDNKNKFLIFALVLLLIPVIVDEANVLLNMGSYNGYPFRLGFVYSFLIFYMASKLINDKWQVFDESTNSNKKHLIDFIIISAIYLVVLVLVFLVLGPILSQFLANQTASWGVLGCYLLVLALLIIPAGLVLINAKTKGLSKKVLTIAMCVITGLQVFVNYGFGVYGSVLSYKTISSVSQMLKENNITTQNTLKDSAEILSRNAHLDVGTKSYSIFSSSTDNYLLDLKSPFSYVNNNTGVSSYGGTIISDAIFGYDYVLSDKMETRPNLEFVDSFTENGLTCYLYKNTLVLNGGLVVNDDFSYEANKDCIKFTNNFYNLLGGDGEVIKEYPLFEGDVVDIKYNNLKLTTLDEKYQFDIIDENKEGYITLSYTATKDSIIYLFTNEKDVDKIYTLTQKQEVEGFRTVSYSLEACLNDLGYVKAGETISLDLRFVESVSFDKTGESSLRFATLDYIGAKNVIEAVKNNTSLEVSTKKDGFTVSTTQTDNTKKLIFPHPYSENYVCTVNGKNVEIKNNNGFIEIDLNEGENKIELTYKNKYTKLMLVCLVVGVVLVTCVLLVTKFFKEKIMKISFIVRYLSIALAVVLVAFFYVFPFFTMLVKMCLGVF